MSQINNFELSAVKFYVRSILWQSILTNLLLLVLEDELPELEVPQDDAGRVARRHRRRHLPEQGQGLPLREVPLVPHVRVQVPVAALEHDVRAGLAHEHLLDGVDVGVGVEPKVAAEHVSIPFVWHYLQNYIDF